MIKVIRYIENFDELYYEAYGNAIITLDIISEAGKENELMDLLLDMSWDRDLSIIDINNLLGYNYEQLFKDLGIEVE